MKYSFCNDYSEGAHPRILEALSKTNLTQETGYGLDSLSIQASELIRNKIQNQNAAIHFVSGGTQANLVTLGSLLRPYESVISATSAHINTHEAGAIETIGHKINAIDTPDGKISASQILEVVRHHSDEHMVKPKVVFISNSTEVGTIYKKQELREISKACKDNKLYLYLDGARLGSALTSSVSDLSLSEITGLVDIFYIGGTKNGALLGEAIVINNLTLQENFRYHLKQRGALLAKGRVMGAQFLELFKDDLFFELARHANEMAEQLVKGIDGLGFKFQTEACTNQIFPLFPNSLIEKLEKMYGFYVWSKINTSSSSIRLVTSWATKKESVDEFLHDLKSLL